MDSLKRLEQIIAEDMAEQIRNEIDADIIYQLRKWAADNTDDKTRTQQIKDIFGID